MNNSTCYNVSEEMGLQAVIAQSKLSCLPKTKSLPEFWTQSLQG